MKLPHAFAPGFRAHRSAALACLILLACARAQATSTAETTRANAAVDQLPPSATLRKIAENGAIVLGTRESSVPFSYTVRQQPVGYSYAIALRIVDELRKRLDMPNLAVKNVMVTSANRISYVVNNQVDLECGSTAHVADREPLVAFSNSFFQYGIRMAVKKKSGIRDYADLANKTVATTAGTSDERMLRQMSIDRKLNLRIISARDHAEAFAALRSDRAVAFVMDDPLLYGKIAQEGNARGEYLVTGASLANEAYGCMMRKGDPVFKKIVDDVIAGMQRSGEAAKLYDTWFMSPIPPDGVNLQFPMSPEMKLLFEHPNDRILD
ncbi:MULTISPECIES: transporter substrate-binding domain-containing protein [unclassified Caballeronia]|uniref:transporter substrate-binding domain-containing protein n=1 Tax=unclassified Caballeronia TaxID=2646786 RepID=UPI0028646517|nr:MULTISPECIES: transporter substrate-binding domain-containing protein [unclassified Caballeronia]MDR5813951.1 transporter substrate-binding domain-containing protein [Caballeronia sp. LZ033]MDR5834395.1 transporter substrate-binding domain-containing protein [Caballeronia sp. LZ034LL]